MKTTVNTMQMTRKMTAVTEAMMTTVWEFMLTAVLLGGGAWVVLEGGKQPAATENAQHEINIVDITDINVKRKKLTHIFASTENLEGTIINAPGP